jgi:hypothetical protein
MCEMDDWWKRVGQFFHSISSEGQETGAIAPAPDNACKKIWEAWSIAPVKKKNFVENNLNHFIHFQLQNNAPYALKLYLK